MSCEAVLLVAYGNSLQALLMTLDGFTPQTIPSVELATGEMRFYGLHEDTKVESKEVLVPRSSRFRMAAPRLHCRKLEMAEFSTGWKPMAVLVAPGASSLTAREWEMALVLRCLPSWCSRHSDDEDDLLIDKANGLFTRSLL